MRKMLMTKEEIFEERRKVYRKLCEEIRANDGQLITAKYFLRDLIATEQKVINSVVRII